MRKEIERLIHRDLSPLQVSAKTGIPQNTVYRIFKGEASLDNITLKNAEKLYSFEKEMENVRKNKKEQMQLAFDLIKLETEGKLSEGVYIQAFDSMEEMLLDFDMTIIEVEENKSFIHDELPNGLFIVRDYNQEDFFFLTEFDEASVNKFIETITLP